MLKEGLEENSHWAPVLCRPMKSSGYLEVDNQFGSWKGLGDDELYRGSGGHGLFPPPFPRLISAAQQIALWFVSALTPFPRRRTFKY